MELQVVSGVDHVERKFGHSVIIWKIENFLLATCKEDWTIFSAEFYVNGPQPTKWKMFLTPERKVDNTFSISFHLERIGPDGPEVVWTNWKATFIDCQKRELCKTECVYVFGMNINYGVEMQDTKHILKELLLLDSDTLTIRCQLIVNIDRADKNWEKPNTIGLRSLSQDLKSLFKRGIFYDVVFRMNGKDIKAHRSIIQSRNQKLASMIYNAPDEKVINLELDFEAMERVFSYLYSGNLEEVLAKPTISLHMCSLKLKIDEMSAFYVPEELMMLTEIDVQEFVFVWMITEWDSRNEDCILSPILNDRIHEISWRLRLYPHGTNDVRYIALFADTVEINKPMDVCMEFGILSTNNETFWLRRFRKSIDSHKLLGFNDFAKVRDLENSSLLAENTFRIVCKLRMSSGTQTALLGNRMASFMTTNSKTSYDSLSCNMKLLLGDRDLTDYTLLVGGESFKVHKCILAARSKKFANMINQVENKSTLNISNIQPTAKPPVMRTVLNYMYSGVLENLNLSNVSEVYAFAGTFALASLRDSCVKNLQDIICLNTVCDILEFASENKENELKSSALEFISRDSKAVFGHVKWSRLVKTRPSLCAEVNKYVRNKS